MPRDKEPEPKPKPKRETTDEDFDPLLEFEYTLERLRSKTPDEEHRYSEQCYWKLKSVVQEVWFTLGYQQTQALFERVMKPLSKMKPDRVAKLVKDYDAVPRGERRAVLVEFEDEYEMHPKNPGDTADRIRKRWRQAFKEKFGCPYTSAFDLNHPPQKGDK
jgi:hypothetical protein